jgi:hypothetical protein
MEFSSGLDVLLTSAGVNLCYASVIDSTYIRVGNEQVEKMKVQKQGAPAKAFIEFIRYPGDNVWYSLFEEDDEKKVLVEVPFIITSCERMALLN